jgi:hypothetical protein
VFSYLELPVLPSGNAPPVSDVPFPGAAELEETLRCSPYLDLRQLRCDVDCDNVVLRGTVPSYYLKQIAEAVATKTMGIQCVKSQIVVRPAYLGIGVGGD